MRASCKVAKGPSGGKIKGGAGGAASFACPARCAAGTRARSIPRTDIYDRAANGAVLVLGDSFGGASQSPQANLGHPRGILRREETRWSSRQSACRSCASKIPKAKCRRGREQLH